MIIATSLGLLAYMIFVFKAIHYVSKLDKKNEPKRIPYPTEVNEKLSMYYEVINN